MFEPDCPESMAAAILRLANDSTLREVLGCAARSLIASRGYTWRHNFERVGVIGAAAARREVGQLLSGGS
jgi:hypothetical protein